MQTSIQNSAGEKLDYSFAPGEETSRKPGWLVVLGHGVTGNKDRPVIADTAAALNAAGFDTLRFSFAGNGESGGDFRDCTISQEVEDLGSVLDAVAGDYPHIVYAGHSMGGAVGVLRASKDDRIQALISIAGMVDTKTFAETEFGSETPDSGLMWEEEDCPLSSAFMKDLCETICSVAPQATSVNIPWLLIHGTADDVVLPKDTQEIQSLKASGVEVVFVEGADHSFGEPDHKKQLTAAVTKWLSDKT